ncbi:hypothetical protein HYW75_04200 [Candidatus Pacearchaeota archaeon]|nr:hypothetical protein [Candidatus Pacearchaeota archaeon]
MGVKFVSTDELIKRLSKLNVSRDSFLEAVQLHYGVEARVYSSQRIPQLQEQDLSDQAYGLVRDYIKSQNPQIPITLEPLRFNSHSPRFEL